MNEVMDIGKKIILKDALIQNHNLSKRKSVIIEYILENETLMPKEFDKLLILMGRTGKNLKGKTTAGITKRTLQRDLKDMIDKKIIEVEGKTNQKFYRLAKKGLNL